MRSTKRIRTRHTEGHFKEPILNSLKEWLSGDQEHWSDFFDSEKKIRKAVGRLRRCTDVLPSMTREFVNEVFDPGYGGIRTYGQLVEAMQFDLNVNSKRAETRKPIMSDAYLPETKAFKQFKKEIENEK